MEECIGLGHRDACKTWEQITRNSHVCGGRTALTEPGKPAVGEVISMDIIEKCDLAYGYSHRKVKKTVG
jgi:hypothetical protein